MDRLKQIRGEAGGSGDSTLDTTAAPSEAYMSANDGSSKYFSLSDSSFDLNPIKDVSLASTTSKIDDSITDPDDLMSNLSPIGKKDILDDFKIGKQIEAGSILSGGVNIFDDNENSFDGDSLVIDDNVDLDDKSLTEKSDLLKPDDVQSTLVNTPTDVPSKDTEVVLQIDGKNVDAIDIGNGLYLYRKYGRESMDELAAVQIIDDGQQQPTFKFLKVRENAEGNLEVYEEFEIEVSKEVPPKEGVPVEKPSHVPNKDINKVISETSNKVAESSSKITPIIPTTTSTEVAEKEPVDKTEVNFNGKMMKFSESRKSPVVGIGRITPMTYHSTPNKEGKPLTKTMVDLQLHPNRHSDNVKKTIEVHTDSKVKVPPESQKKLFAEDTTISDTGAVIEEKISEVIPEESSIDEDISIVEKEESTAKEIIDKAVTDKEPQTDEKVVKEDIAPEVEIVKPISNEATIEKEVPAVEGAQEKKGTIVECAIEKTTTVIENENEKEGAKVEGVQETEAAVIESEKVKEGPLVESEKVKEIVVIEGETQKEAPIESIEPPINVAENPVNIDIKQISEEKIETPSIIAEKVVEEEPIKSTEETKPQTPVLPDPIVPVESTTSETTVESIPTKIEEPVPEQNVLKLCEEKPVQSENKDPISGPTAVNEITDSSTDAVCIQSNEALIVDMKKQDTPTIEQKVDKIEATPSVSVDQVDKATDDVIETIDDDDNLVINEDLIKPTDLDIDIPKSDLESDQDKLVIVEKSVEMPSSTTKLTKNVVDTVVATPSTTEKLAEESKVLKSEPKEAVQPKSNEKAVVKDKDVKMRPELIVNKVISAKAEAVDKKPIEVEIIQSKTSASDQKEIPKIKINQSDMKPINNNHNAVPFGQWTAANRQEFLNKFKDAYKAPVNSNTKQIKNSNDLNRRDVLKKIDSQRQQSNIASAKEKTVVKNETIFSSKLPTLKTETKTSVKKDVNDPIEVKPKVASNIDAAKPKLIEPPKQKIAEPMKSKVVDPIKGKPKEEPRVSIAVASSTVTTCTVSGSTITKTEVSSRKEVNVNDLINRTIEDMINNGPSKALEESSKAPIVEVKVQELPKQEKPKEQKVIVEKKEPVKVIDDIEMKMNELHGIPFVERPPHQLPKVLKTELRTYSRADKENPQNKAVKKVETAVVNPPKPVIEAIIDIDSEEEAIEHEPVTGDIQIKKSVTKPPENKTQEKNKPVPSPPKKEAVITENDFDKFARRNSVTYDDYLTVNYDKKEPHSAQPVRNVTKVATFKPKTEIITLEPKSKLPPKPTNRPTFISGKPISKIVVEKPNNKNYQSKIHLAYQNVLTAKMDRQVSRPEDRPITIIEDKPVKVVFMDAGPEFVPGQLNVQGKELSPAKKTVEADVSATKPADTKPEPVDPDMSEIEEKHDDNKTKTKHQRKQVLTPVEAPEIELIQPKDLSSEASPKKKRKTDDNKSDKHYKNLVHKKSYLLGRSTITEDKVIPQENNEVTKTPPKEVKVNEEVQESNNTESALYNLVKAAELIEQSGSINTSIASTNSESSQNTPVKRGRGRPRKYPLPEGTVDNKLPSPQKKPRLIDAKPVKQSYISDTDSSDEDGVMVKENWTMGKINENIVCPICNKLFRSENVVFKHVKHCTGVSPNRSDSDKRSPRRGRHSQESDLRSLDSRSEDMDLDSEDKSNDSVKHTPRKRKPRETGKEESDKSEVIVIEDTPPVKEKKKDDDDKDKKKLSKPALGNLPNGLVCEICGKTFRQLSYLVNHRLQHKREETKKPDKPADAPSKSQVFSCEICKKEFRKLHHLVQHRIIHNPSVPSRTLRKTSSEQTDNKNVKEKEQPSLKQSEDPSAAFRCEPCDKSFRKLHHLVEHRETHDGINRQKTVANPPPVVEKPTQPPQCDVCKKTFRKLHHLIEHKEQHEPSSEKSGEKSSDKEKMARNALSTKDIIHECSLCYMVFPNEHSLNKHTVNCQKKKRQSKSAKNVDEESSDNTEQDKDGEESPAPKIIAQEVIDDDDDEDDIVPLLVSCGKKETPADDEKSKKIVKEPSVEMPLISEVTTTEKEKPKLDVPLKENIEKPIQSSNAPVKRDLPLSEKNTDPGVVIPEKIKKVEDKEKETKPSKKRTPIKEKLAPSITKRQKSDDTKPQPFDEAKPSVESSDDDEVRYMLNPDFKVEETEGKTFMEVRANKRNSLQIERPNSKDLAKRRTSLQHPPKIPRLKPKPVEPKVVPTSQPAPKVVHKVPKLDAATSTDSDDSDVKYSFPKTVPEKTSKPERQSKSTEKTSKPERTQKPVEKPSKSVEKASKAVEKPSKPERSDSVDKKPGRKSVVDKRKSLSGIAKRKSLGEALKHKVKGSPIKVIRKRTTEVEHRCDCGQLFSSAALLTRHTSLAHTPPRIRRRRSPPPDVDTLKPPRKSTEPKPPRKSSVKSDVSTSKTRKSMKPEATTPETRKSEVVKTTGKTKRATPAHRGVPVPEKMRKMMMKMKK